MPIDGTNDRGKPGRILVADDIPENRDLLESLLVRDGYVVETAEDGAAAMDAIARVAPDLVLSDVVMPRMTGFELCRRVKDDRTTRLIPVVLVTELSDRDDRIQGINAGADDFLTKPVDTLELRARVRSLLRLKRFTDDLDSAESVILSLARTVEARDPYTSGHCERLAGFALAFGAALDLSPDEVAALHRGGYLHDVGKIAIPDGVLTKPGPLSEEERALVRRHPIIGEELCGDLRQLRLVRPIVRHHHERFDGSGYPDGLSGDTIPLLAQIMAIVDVYDALTTDRSYRPAMTLDAACRELRAEASRGWHRRELVDRFFEVCATGFGD